MADTLLTKLEATRDGWREEGIYHRFLADSYTGGGGYQGKVQLPPSGYWGAAAEIYAAVNPYWFGVNTLETSYLDKHPREDIPKYESRKAISHYLNYVEPLTDLKLSYLLRKPFTWANEVDAVSKWRQDIDGNGRTWDDVRPSIALNAAICGWCPVLFDRPETPDGMSVAQAARQGLDRWTTIPLAPSNLVQWKECGGELEWVKIRTCYVEQESWDSEPARVDDYAIWTRQDVTRFEVRDDGRSGGSKSVVELGTKPHKFGRVPVVIFRHKRSPDLRCCVTGLPMHAQIAMESRRLFNLTSEFDEHIRSQVFAVLVLVGGGAGASEGGEVTLGTDNGLPLSPDAKNQHYYLAPPASVAATLEKRTEATVQEIYRMARSEYSRAIGAPTSGVARRYEFASTNRAIADFGSEFARGEQDLAQLIAIGMGTSPDKAKAQRVSAPDDYDIDDLPQDIKNTLDAVTVGLGPTATAEIKGALVQRLIPQLSPDLRKKIQSEIETAERTKAATPPPAMPPLNGPPVPTPSPTPPPA